MAVWVLRPPNDEAYLAEWTGAVRLETVRCPVEPGHQRAGRRTTNLTIRPPRRFGDFAWTPYGECLLRGTALERIRQAGLSGFDVHPVDVESSHASLPGGRVWELAVTGWAGVAPPESGVALDAGRSCAHCGHLVYTAPSSPGALFSPE